MATLCFWFTRVLDTLSNALHCLHMLIRNTAPKLQWPEVVWPLEIECYFTNYANTINYTIIRMLKEHELWVGDPSLYNLIEATLAFSNIILAEDEDEADALTI